MSDYIIIAVLGCVVALDTTVAGQFMISQPLVSSAIAGYMFGDIESGIYIGAIMQLMWLKLIPAGGSIYLNGNLGTLVAVCVLLLSSSEFPFSEDSIRFVVIIYGIAMSYIFGYFTTRQRAINLFLIGIAKKAFEKNQISRFQAVHFLGVIITGIGGSIIVVFFTAAGKWLLFHIPPPFFMASESFFPYGLFAFFGIGIGTVLSMVWSNKTWHYSAIGIAMGIVFLFLT